MTGGLDRQNEPLGDVWILDIERGNWRKVRLNFTLYVVYIHIFILCMLYIVLICAGECYSEGSQGSLSHSCQSWSRTDRGSGVWRVS